MDRMSLRHIDRDTKIKMNGYLGRPKIGDYIKFTPTHNGRIKLQVVKYAFEGEGRIMNIGRDLAEDLLDMVDMNENGSTIVKIDGYTIGMGAKIPKWARMCKNITILKENPHNYTAAFGTLWNP